MNLEWNTKSTHGLLPALLFKNFKATSDPNAIVSYGENSIEETSKIQFDDLSIEQTESIERIVIVHSIDSGVKSTTEPPKPLKLNARGLIQSMDSLSMSNQRKSDKSNQE